MKRSVKKVILWILVAVIIFCVANVWVSYNWLTVTKFTVESEQIENPFRIVLVSDLHNHQFGKDNHRLIEKIEAQSPDLIVLDGDMINNNSKNSEVAVKIIEQLKDVAPVYYSLGNHEYEYIEAGTPDLIDELEEAGAIVLDHKIYDIEVNGNEIRLGGLYEYGFETSMQTEEENEKAVAYLEEFTDTDRYQIICPHRPESLYCWDFVDQWGIDLQLSGHLHGGQVIVPLKGGLYSPLEQWFPKYDYGQYELGNSTMIITRGLGSNLKALPRFNNPPEIAVIDVLPKKE